MNFLLFSGYSQIRSIGLLQDQFLLLWAHVVLAAQHGYYVMGCILKDHRWLRIHILFACSMKGLLISDPGWYWMVYVLVVNN